jgi:formamidopyrimidine-DNA glycosylase
MPEGPEVSIIAKNLNDYASGKTLTELKVLSGRYLRAPLANIDKIINAKILEISNKGKFIYWKFDNNYVLFSTLGMSGVYSKNPSTHSRLHFILDKSLDLWYTDVRNFGTFKVTDNAELNKKLKELGPDMLNKPCLFDEFKAIVEKNKNWILGPFLLEQKKISGVGNIYKSEICYLAGIDPSRTLSSLSEEETHRLYTSICSVLTRAYGSGGSSQKDYKDLDENLGTYLSAYSQVYRRTHDRLGNPVISCDLNDGRTTWWCPNVQK